MTAEQIAVLTQRLERLELSYRRLKQVALLFLVVASAVVLMGQVLPDASTVEATEFILKDHAGRTRGVFGARDFWTEGEDDPRGQCGLHIYAPDGQYLAGFAELTNTISGVGSVLKLTDTDTQSTVTLAVSGALADLSLLATEESRETLAVRERQRQEVARARAAGTSVEDLLRMFSPVGVHGRFVAGPNGTSALTLTHGRSSIDRLGGIDVSLSEEGEVALQLSDPEGTTRAVLGRTDIERPATAIVEQRPASSLVLFDANRRVIWQAPY